ncbi:MAG: alpha/beta hydrolase [Caldilineaceae bacterium]|nr:alpha/beta hydrolase [Caldilineaceae bacterium]
MAALFRWLRWLAAFVRSYLRLNTLLFRATTGTLMRRFRYGPRRPTWSRQFETMVQVMALGLPHARAFDVNDIRTPLKRLTGLPLPLWLFIHPATDCPVPAEWVRVPKVTGGPVMLYLHGGGFVAGSPQTHRLLTTQLARVTRLRILAVDYRLAPEHPYPAALADAWAAYWWLLTEGVSPAEIIVAGDSAGGGLAVALLVALRDANMPLPAGAVCLSPWFDLALEGASVHRQDQIDYLNKQVLAGCADHYLNGTDPHAPLASPLYADLRGLPPLLIQAGATELLVDDSRRLAARARAAGVEVELDLRDDLVHVFQFFFLISSKARDALNRIERFVNKHIGQPPEAEQATNHSAPVPTGG